MESLSRSSIMSKKYKEILDEISEKVQKVGGTRHSSQDFTAITHALINDTSVEIPVYMGDDETAPASSNPVVRYRDSLKPILREFGVDNAELGKIQKVDFTKEHAEALNGIAMQAIKDYTKCGRKLIFPVTDKNEAQMEIYQDVVKEKETKTTKPEQQPDGSYKQVPTGETKTTKEHRIMKASNKVPGWLITKEKSN